ncbi:hypothetical protein [Maribacter sp. 2210JD10-5]|uniref:hypothetical protein n=1 Tax=Maribacter sp. 2210JD10-5 TaxID=3386272 RepID=UPI0039BD1D2A
MAKYVVFLTPIYLLLQFNNDYTIALKTGPSFQEDIKSQAFKVLQTKCNTCHATKKRQDIFTFKNMDSLSPEIYKQVFVKKKMPKGRKATLTTEESDALLAWINDKK